MLCLGRWKAFPRRLCIEETSTCLNLLLAFYFLILSAFYNVLLVNFVVDIFLMFLSASSMRHEHYLPQKIANNERAKRAKRLTLQMRLDEYCNCV